MRQHLLHAISTPGSAKFIIREKKKRDRSEVGSIALHKFRKILFLNFGCVDRVLRFTVTANYKGKQSETFLVRPTKTVALGNYMYFRKQKIISRHEYRFFRVIHLVLSDQWPVTSTVYLNAKK